MILTSEQKQVIESVYKDIKVGNKQIVVIGGVAGVGKSSILKVLHELLPMFAPVVYTGKGASVLRRKGVRTAATIHSTIYSPVIIGDKVTFELKPTLEWDGFLVDESQMVNEEQYEDLLSFDKPIVFIGDHGQLEPVGKNINLMANPDYKLETIHRNAGEIAHFANHLRQGGIAREFKTEGAVQIAGSRQVTDNHLTSTSQIIAAFNRFRVQMNLRVRKSLNRKNLIDNGEKIICLRNNKRINIFNGLQGEASNVINVGGGLFTLDFSTPDQIIKNCLFDPNQFNMEKGQLEIDNPDINLFDYAYCVTAHKSIGDQYNNTLIYEQYCDKWDMKRWNYTCASRAINSVIWVEDPKVIRMKYEKPEINEEFM